MKDIDSKKLNELISLAKKILKIFYIVIIIAGIYGLTIVFKEWQIASFTLKCLKIVAPLFIGIIIAWLFNPLVDKLQKKGIKRGLGATIVYALFILLICLIVGSMIPLLANQINEFAKSVPSIFNNIEGFINNIFNGLGNIGNFDAMSLKNDMLIKLESYTTSLTSDLPLAFFEGIKSIFSGLSTFVIGLIIGFFLLLSFDNVNNLLSFLPRGIKEDTKTLGDEIDGSLRSFVNGTLILSLLVFAVTSLGLWISGLNSPLIFGIFCGITNVIPYIGPYLGGVPAVIVGFAQGPLVGLGVLITIALVQFIEGNLLQPIVMSKTMKLHPVTIILGLLIFEYFWGIVGMVVATPVIAVVKVIFMFFDRKYNLLTKKA